VKVAGKVVAVKALRDIKPGDTVFACSEELDAAGLDDLQDQLMKSLEKNPWVSLLVTNYKVDLKILDIPALEALIEEAQHRLVIAQRGVLLAKRASMKRSGRLPSKATLIRKT